MRRIRRHLTYANVMVTILAFVVLGGGTALAAYVVSSNSQIGPGTVSGHKPPSGDHANVIAASINGQDVADNSLRGADIADRSGVDTCQTPLTIELGAICAGSDGGARNWNLAEKYCAGYGLRLPTLAEARTLAINYDVPGVSDTQDFWTDEEVYQFNDFRAEVVAENGLLFTSPESDDDQTVCVTDPSA
jgi:hypothetical protein